jgi:biopolymer transport protein ExbD
MGRFRNQIESSEDAAIDMSPLIDCVFILLIFFIVTTVFVEEPGVDVDKPSAVSAKQLEKTSILFAVTEDGAVVYGGRDVGLHGVRAIVARLTQKEQIPVIIQGDRNAESGLPLRVMDEARLAQAERIFFSTEITRQ